MGFKKFRIICSFRVLLVICSIFLLAFVIFKTNYFLSAGIIGLVIILQVFDLIRYVEKTNKKLTHFLEAIRYSDFTVTFSDEKIGKSFQDLNQAFNDVIREFRKTRKEKEEHFNYLQTVVHHINIGIIVFRKDGQVDLINNAFKKLFKLASLQNINQLNSIDIDLPKVLTRLKGDTADLIKLSVENEILQLSIRSTEFKLRNEEFMLVSVQNIYFELEEKEMESWQKLTKVLTHEIMNSITPISSLASTMKEILNDQNGQPIPKENIDNELIENIHDSLNIIERRSQGLLNFVDIYRNLTRIPKPNFRHFLVQDLLNTVIELHRQKISKSQINCMVKVVPENLMLLADPDLIEQVLINLFINAMHATADIENPKILFLAEELNGKTLIHVVDNGKGIKPDMMEKIFIPFFTSKKDGSGIGLSLSRQIMFLHKGFISASSEEGKDTVFTLRF